MTEQQKTVYFEKYNERTHLVGRIGLIIGLVLMLSVPFAVGAVLDAMPDVGSAAKGLAQVALVYIPSCIVEFLIYTPMLGAGGSYLAFITGNLINMKIPCAINARDIVEAEAGTPENEIVSTLSIATSSLVTTLVITVGVLLLIPLQPVLEMPALQPAFNNVVPALFGALGMQYFSKSLKLTAGPLVLMSMLCIFIPSLATQTSTMMLPCGAFALVMAYVLWKKDKL